LENVKGLNMPINFADHNEFDKYVRDQKWNYNNRWSYKGEFFSAYIMEGFGRIELGRLIDYLVMLRDDELPNKTIIIHGINTQLDEIWLGFENSQDEYHLMMYVVNKFIEDYQNNSRAT
jgi:hypothetical protein